jgi:hypothetical protein
MKRKEIWRRYRIDVIALIIFGLVTSFTTIIYEVLLAGTSPEQWLGIRIIYNILRFAGAYLLGDLIEKIRAKLAPKGGFISKALADACALSLYQLPIYFISALIMQVSLKSMLITAVLYVLDNIFLGWVYGYTRDRVKIFFFKKALKKQAKC